MHPLRILLLCDNNRSHADTLLEHVAAFKRYSAHDVSYFNPRGVLRAPHLNLNAFDVVVIHYSLVVTSDNYLAPSIREQIRRFQGLKVQFIQDEYRWVDDITAMMRYLEIAVLFSIVPEREIENVYGGRLPSTEIVTTLAGYVPEKLVGFRSRPLDQRRLDVGYRGRVLPFWNGALSQEKVTIGREFAARAATTHLRCDIAWGEEDRIYGSRWHAFLASCRTTLGSESGTSITDFDGSVEARVVSFLANHPGASFEQVSREVLEGVEANVMMNVVSPRLFEAAAIGTAMILFPGEYGGVVEPWRHYVPLAKDFSNFDEVVASVGDTKLLEELVRCSRHDIVDLGDYSLRRFISSFDEVVSARARRRTGLKRSPKLIRANVYRVRDTKAFMGVDVKGAAIRSSQLAAAAYAAHRDPALRLLVRRYLSDRRLRKRLRLGRVAHDVLRVGFLRAEQGRSLSISVRMNGDDSISFVSHPIRAAPIAEPGDHTLNEASVILWDHRAVGLVFTAQLPGSLTRPVPVGYYGVNGVHHLGAIEQLRAAFPRETDNVLAPLRTAPPPPPEDAWTEPAARQARRPLLSARVVVRRISAAPPGTTAKGTRLLYAFASDSEIRRIFSLWRTSPPGIVSAESIASELLKFHLLRRAACGRVRSVPGLQRVEDAHRILYRTLAVPSPAVQAPQVGPKMIVWDHTAVGHALEVNERTSLRLGAAGSQAFELIYSLVHEGLRDVDKVRGG